LALDERSIECSFEDRLVITCILFVDFESLLRITCADDEGDKSLCAVAEECD
jgi:hypothetical protein